MTRVGLTSVSLGLFEAFSGETHMLLVRMAVQQPVGLLDLIEILNLETQLPEEVFIMLCF